MNPTVSNTRLFTTTGNKNYELSNHLGNVLAVITDKKIPRNTENTPFFETQITSVSDFYPFGSLLEGRHESSEDYRYAFNGMERDDEVKGAGNHLDFGARCFDTRLGKFLSLDPRMGEFAFQSPYAYALNNPILFVDENGEGPVIRFQSLTASYSVMRALTMYQSGMGSFKEVNDKLKDYQLVGFQTMKNNLWAKKMFKKSGLGELYRSGDKKTMDRDWNSHGSETITDDVAYQTGYIDDEYIYIELLQEDDDGNWSYHYIKVIDEDQIESNINKLNNQLDELQRQLANLRAQYNENLRDISGAEEEQARNKWHERDEGGSGATVGAAIRETYNEIQNRRLKREMQGIEQRMEPIQNKIKQEESKKKEVKQVEKSNPSF